MEEIKAIYLEWVDSSCWTGWQDKLIPKKNDGKCFSCGIFVVETDRFITIAHSVSIQGHYSDQMTIPKVAITKRKWIKLMGVKC